MSFIVKNPHDHEVKVGVTYIDPKQQIAVIHMTPEIQAAIDKGDLIISGSGDPTAAERHADVAAIKPLRVGDPAIDGEK